MYDALTTAYTFSCPTHGETRVRLSGFRQLEELPGASHPAVYRVEFACGCGDDHPGLVTHEELDWAPLGLVEGTYVNLMTSRVDAVASELGDLAARRIQSGRWPWSFYCYPEERPRPVFPRSEEHTSELQSRGHLVCRLLLEKKKNKQHPALSLNKQTLLHNYYRI